MVSLELITMVSKLNPEQNSSYLFWIRTLALAITRGVAWSLGFILLILLITEGLLRLHQAFFLSLDDIEVREYRARVIQQIEEQWLNTHQTDPYLPPYLVYGDNNYNDEARLKKVFESTRAKPNVETTSWDFIQGPEHAANTTYHIRTNSLGFRGRERSQEKPKGTKRIIVLGAYQAFGHGVNDDESYPAQLEQELNHLDHKSKYEVWNGGRHSDTAIVALARLKNEIFNYAPDLLIIDYGFVDPLVWSDNLMITAARLPDGRLYANVKAGWKTLLPFLFKTRVFNALIDFLVKQNYRHNVADFVGTMQAILSLAADKKVPVILVRQIPVEIEGDVYQRLKKPGVKLVDVSRVFQDTPPSPTVLRECHSEHSWLRDAPAAMSKPKSESRFCYFLDPLQLNAEGQKVLAQSLAQTVLKDK
jgi:hypothetical protein